MEETDPLPQGSNGEQRNASNTNPQASGERKQGCYKCGEPHFQRDCPRNKKANAFCYDDDAASSRHSNEEDEQGEQEERELRTDFHLFVKIDFQDNFHSK